MSTASMVIHFREEPLELLPQRAVWWEKKRTLFVADCHVGKAATFRHHGVPVPEGNMADDLKLLCDLITHYQAERLMVLGDFFHAPEGYHSSVVESLIRWRQQIAHCQLGLVPGNHDRKYRAIALPLKLEVYPALMTESPFIFTHEPVEKKVDDHLHLSGHWHPLVALAQTRGRQRRVPCFWRHGANLVLPSFGSFTSGQIISPEDTDDVYAIAGDRVLAVPVALCRRSI
jgi:DNA ligase-associated metallophosphoesterase